MKKYRVVFIPEEAEEGILTELEVRESAFQILEDHYPDSVELKEGFENFTFHQALEMLSQRNYSVEEVPES